MTVRPKFNRVIGLGLAIASLSLLAANAVQAQTNYRGSYHTASMRDAADDAADDVDAPTAASKVSRSNDAARNADSPRPDDTARSASRSAGDDDAPRNAPGNSPAPSRPNASSGKSTGSAARPRSTEPPRAGSRAFMEQRTAAAEPVKPSATMQPTGPTRGYDKNSEKNSEKGTGAARAYPEQRTSAQMPAGTPRYRTAQTPTNPRGDVAYRSSEMVQTEELPPHSMPAQPGRYVPHDPGTVHYGPEPLVEEAGSCGCGSGCSSGGCGGCGCGITCGSCCGGCGGGCGQGGFGICIGISNFDFLNNLTVFAGPEAFKGPLDFAANGNFGFHEGMNLGCCLCGCEGVGMQIGFQLIESDFENGQLTTDNRDQIFVTGGAFHRPTCCDQGCTAGLVVDYLHDDFYCELDLVQIRTSIGYQCCSNELGFEATVGVNHSSSNTLRFGHVDITARDQYVFYLQRTMCEGAQSRAFVGLTSNAEPILGVDLRVPISCCVAVQGGFTWMIPDHPGSLTPGEEETWNLGANVVWHPFQRAKCYGSDPCRPMFNVADNGSLLERPRR